MYPVKAIPMSTNINPLTKWADESKRMLGEYLQKCESLLNAKPNYDTNSEFVLAQLFYNCHLISESSILLVENQKSWESQILTRSVVEGTFRYVYICTKNKDDHEQRIREFMEDLPDLSQIREFEKINTFLAQLAQTDKKSYEMLRGFSRPASYVNDLRHKYPTSKKRGLPQRWSLMQILQAVAGSEFPDMKKYLNIGIQYAMASHFVHQDSDAIQLLWMRNNPKEKSPMYSEVVIGAKELAANLEMAHLRSMAIHYFIGKDLSEVESIYKRHIGLLMELSKATHIAIQYEMNRKQNKK